MKQILFLLTSILIAFSCSSPINQTNKENFTKEDSSLVKYEIPEWYQDAKIGYWCTWGLYSIPAYAGDHAAEWYG